MFLMLQDLFEECVKLPGHSRCSHELEDPLTVADCQRARRLLKGGHQIQQA